MMNAGPVLQQQPADGFARTKSRRGYTRQRQGCLTCRRRKKKCDQCFPICGHCLRLNLACEREQPRRVPTEAKAAIVKEQNTAELPTQEHNGHVAKIYAYVDGAALRNETSGTDLVASRRAILRYYTTVFAALLSTNHENNSFLSVMLPMAFECSALMKSLVAWASSNLAARDAEFQQVALQHRGSALNALKAAIEDKELSGEMCLAVAMVFCSMESISDASGSWYHHLLGGAAALGHSKTSTDQSDTSQVVRMSSIEGHWLLRNFAYHDALMSVTLDCRPLITGHYWVMPEAGQADSYFGLASRIIYLVSKISVLNANLAELANASSTKTQPPTACQASMTAESGVLTFQHSSHPSSQPITLSDAYDIEAELLNWACPVGFADSPLHLLAESYRGAALLHLYRTLRRHITGATTEIGDKIMHQVASVCDVITQMPDGCLAECTLLFPLFMAGGEASLPSHIEMIRTKMELINQYRHFQNVTQALEVLNDLWRLKSAGVAGTHQREVDWLDITKSRNIKLSIT